MKERRRSARLQLRADMRAKINTVQPSRIIDISLHGIQLETTRGLQRRMEYRLTVPTPEGPLQLRATVRHCCLTALRREDDAPGAKNPTAEASPVYRAGLEFVDVTSEQRGVLQRYFSARDGRPEMLAARP
jgi:hypothetical protein